MFKPATDTPFLGLKLYEVTAEAGLPAGVFNFVTGSGSVVGQELVDHAGIDGIVFTGSKEVGMKLIRDNGARPIPRPLVIEMGGKNPALIMRSADLDKAADGVMRSAFGAQGSEVLGLLPSLRLGGGAPTICRDAGREDEAPEGWEPARPRHLAGTRDQPRGREDV